ncbi:hypothetical protein BamMEX5DRAFT_0835 [Burkholderia ambifaria MEX-5]|uniref:Uncharacterized protein n=1 Tax=Burkholderia ambifaria MEX-5 TaxID=396597 RepID=B1SZ69_9BURK|nr:hypothetical protein BamMEX5DRAFT_0835 [Burkholderia ambifaria MEX-5]
MTHDVEFGESAILRTHGKPPFPRRVRNWTSIANDREYDNE